MSPRHISVDEARRRIAIARSQLMEAIAARQMGEEEQVYLQGVLDRGEASCQKAESEFAAKPK